jgi:hypothetical protein
LVDDIAGTLYWVTRHKSPIHLQCCCKKSAKSLHCGWGALHPYNAHHKLAIILSYVLFHTHINPAHDSRIVTTVSSYLEFCLDQRIHLAPFTNIIKEIYAYWSEIYVSLFIKWNLLS